MARGKNAQLAVDMFHALRKAHGWSKDEAWKGIAILLLSCKVFSKGWQAFHDVVVFKDSNEFKIGPGGPSAAIKKGQQLTHFLAQELGVAPTDVCNAVGTYWAAPAMYNVQPNNPVGNAFRSLVAEILKTYGNPNITFEEEVDPYTEFPGHSFQTRSKNPKLDIVARNAKNQTVAILSVRWRFRHDRVDVIDESLAYIGPARRTYKNCNFYAMLGEFTPARLEKVLDHSPPAHKNPSIAATVHFHPELVTKGLGENGRMAHLTSLAWLIDQTYSW